MVRKLLVMFGLCVLGLRAAKGELGDEVVAGCDANCVAIQQGQFGYSVRYEVCHERLGEIGEILYDVDVKFLGKKVRWDYHGGRQDGMRFLRDGETITSFNARRLGSNDPEPYFVALQYDKSLTNISAEEFHPRFVGHGDLYKGSPDQSIADLLRLSRNFSSDRTISVEEVGDNISIIIIGKHTKRTYIVDPQKGYGVVRVVVEQNGRDKPFREVDCDYAKVGNNAYVATSLREIVRVPEQDRYIDGFRRVVTLTHSSCEAPDSENFTLDGLGLPKGARVSDERTGEVHLHKVDAVTEEEVDEAIQRFTEKPFGDHVTEGKELPKQTSVLRTVVILLSVVSLMVIGVALFYKRGDA